MKSWSSPMHRFLKTILNTNDITRLMKDDTTAYISKYDARVQLLQNSENLQNRMTDRKGNMKLFYRYRKYT